MNNDKQTEKIFLLISFVFIIGFTGFYFLKPTGELIENEEESVENTDEEMPSTLVEGFISEINSDYLLLEIIKPNKLSGKEMEIVLTENTSYNELLLEEHGKDDIRNLGTEVMEPEKLEDGSRVLVTFAKKVDEKNFNDDLEAINISLITVRIAN